MYQRKERISIKEKNKGKYDIILPGDFMKSTIYNEDRYLKGDYKALRIFLSLQEEYLEKIKIEQEAYKNLIEEYQYFLEQVVNLLKSLNLKTPLEYSIALSYLIEKGYLSDNKTMTRKESQKELISSYGTTIIRGYGCCRNYASLHKDILDKLKMYGKKLYCRQNTSFLPYKEKNYQANHVLTLIKEEDRLYGIDLYNYDHLYYFKKAFQLEEIALYSNQKIRYKPYYEIIMGESNIHIIEQTLKTFQKESEKKEKIPSIIYTDEIRFPLRKEQDKKIEQFEEFHIKNKILKKEISKELGKIKRPLL